VSKLADLGPSHIKYTTKVGITICIVIRLQESVVACVLQPWSGGKDPDRYIFTEVSSMDVSITLDHYFQASPLHCAPLNDKCLG
jgi:hypothetical protein